MPRIKTARCQLQEKYVAIIAKHEDVLKKSTPIFNIMGYAKLALVLLVGVLAFITFADGFSFLPVFIGAPAAAVLVVLWINHIRLHERINRSKGIISICSRQIDRITGGWVNFEDTGAEYIDTEHRYACDLDIVGQKSVFQLLNTTHTWHGRQRFASDLLNPDYCRAELLERQAAISELSKDTEFSCDIEYSLSKIGVASSAVSLIDELENSRPLVKSRAVRFMLTYLPILSLAFIAATIIFALEIFYITSGAIILAQAVIWVAGLTRTHRYTGTIASMPYRLSAYTNVIDMLVKKDFSCIKLKQMQSRLREASEAIRELGRIADMINAKSNGIVGFLLNIFLLWDYRCALSLTRWKLNHSHLAEGWFATVGEFESMQCFSHLPNICSNACMPTILKDGKTVTAHGMGHLLLPNESRVNNDVHSSDNIFIISGSNMSGKTTFLRTVGVNLVLARLGSFVCAEQMACSLMSIMTSMRLADSLGEGISTFYAELKRIKGIIEMAEKEPEMMFLIDEIFRGTNSIDRLAGAKTVISKLDALGAAGMVSTHDLELCSLDDVHVRVRNYSFSERYENNAIFFEYKLRPGKSTTTNAEYLMKMVGI